MLPVAAVKVTFGVRLRLRLRLRLMVRIRVRTGMRFRQIVKCAPVCDRSLYAVCVVKAGMRFRLKPSAPLVAAAKEEGQW